MKRKAARAIKLPTSVAGVGPFLGWTMKVPGGCTWVLVFSVYEGELFTRSTPTGRAGFRALEVRETVGGELRIVRECAFARRWRAKDRAWKWWCDRGGYEFRSWNGRRRLTKAEREERISRLRG